VDFIELTAAAVPLETSGETLNMAANTSVTISSVHSPITNTVASGQMAAVLFKAVAAADFEYPGLKPACARAGYSVGGSGNTPWASQIKTRASIPDQGKYRVNTRASASCVRPIMGRMNTPSRHMRTRKNGPPRLAR
jgi:hypothetical protein